MVMVTGKWGSDTVSNLQFQQILVAGKCQVPSIPFMPRFQQATLVDPSAIRAGQCTVPWSTKDLSHPTRNMFHTRIVQKAEKRWTNIELAEL